MKHLVLLLLVACLTRCITGQVETRDQPEITVFAGGTSVHARSERLPLMASPGSPYIRYVLQQMRSFPTAFGAMIKEVYVSSFDPVTKIVSAADIKIVEGMAVLNEAMEYMAKQTPNTNEVALDTGLSAAAYELAEIIVAKGEVTHIGSEGSKDVLQRVLKYGSFSGEAQLGESIYACYQFSAAQAFTDMIIDDGVPSRGRRLNLFSNYERIGVGFIPVAKNPKGYAVLTLVFSSGNYKMDVSKITPEIKSKLGLP